MAEEVNKLIEIPLELVIPTPDNPRRIAEGDPRIAERAESIKAHGLLSPVICRPHPEFAGKYDLRAGCVRYMAHKLLGRPTILAMVRELTDAQAMEVTVIENLQRNDLTPLEEARGVAALMATGRDVRDVAEQVGKSPAWVCRRKALAELAPCWADLAEGVAPVTPGRKKKTNAYNKAELTVQHLELLARFPRDSQERLFENLQDHEWAMRPGNFDQFERLMAEETLSLKGCSFDASDSSLVAGKPACTACPRRASVNPGLFDDDLDAAKLRKNDQCLDRPCFEAKLAAGLEAARREYQQQYPDLKLIRTKYSSDPKIEKLPEAGKDSWSKNMIVKEGAAGAKPALVVHGEGKGKVVWIVAQKHNDDGEMVPTGPKTLKVKRRDLELRRRAKTIELIRDDLKNQGALWAGMTWETRGAIITAFSPGDCDDHAHGKELFAALDKRMDDPAATIDALWQGMVLTLRDALRNMGTLENLDTKHWGLWDTTKAICLMLGLNIGVYHGKACLDITEPKAWAAEEKEEKKKSKKPAKESAKNPKQAECTKLSDLEEKEAAKYARRMMRNEKITAGLIGEESGFDLDQSLRVFDRAVDLRYA